MIERNNKVKSIKKDRIKIRNMKDFNKALQTENYNFNVLTEEEFKEKIINELNVNNKICEEMYRTLKKENIIN